MIPYPYTGPSIRPASDGGRGAFAFDDTSVYGIRQQAESRLITVTNGVWIPAPMISGGGGGGKANHQLPHGGRAPGVNPNGVVLLRLFQLD